MVIRGGTVIHQHDSIPSHTAHECNRTADLAQSHWHVFTEQSHRQSATSFLSDNSLPTRLDDVVEVSDSTGEGISSEELTITAVFDENPRRKKKNSYLGARFLVDTMVVIFGQLNLGN